MCIQSIHQYILIKPLSQLRLLLPMFLWRHSKKSSYLEYCELFMADPKMDYFFLESQILTNQLWLYFKKFWFLQILQKILLLFFERPLDTKDIYMPRIFAMTSQKHRQ